jgi:flagellar P-ring protein precursor FlgI
MSAASRSFACLMCLAFAAPAWAQVRIKDVTRLEGVRSNQLYGFGLVTGLAGTGSRSLFTQQVAVDMLQRQGVAARIFNQTPADPVLRSTSIAAVMVIAEIGPFNRCGSRIDVTVSAIDDTSSLQGGTLILTPLRGPDGAVYAVAQGPMSIGGFILGGAATTVQKNHPNVGRIPGGGLVEKEALGDAVCKGKSRFLLEHPDLDTARKIARAMNEHCPGCALAEDAGAVAVCLPKPALCNPVPFLSELGQLEIRPDVAARVVVNERTGTVVVGADVKLATTAVAHGNLTILVAENPQASQPSQFGGGNTVVLPRTTVQANEAAPRLNLVPGVPRSATVADLARALNALGVSPRDLISIFQALKRAGALYAELEVI